MTISTSTKIKEISILNSRFGPTERQLDAFKRIITKFKPASNYIFNHGADRGDTKIHSLLKMMGFQIIGWPTGHDEWDFDLITKYMPKLGLTDRNRKLVDIADIIIGIPQAMNEFEDSPQWKTLRAAYSAEKEIYIASPNGYAYKLEI